jgi:ferric-dicitrate binding protein FerR (iron transport regulator)
MLKKYREGKATEEEILIIEQWYRSLGKDNAGDTEIENLNVSGERIWNNIEAQRSTEAAQPSKARFHMLPLFRIAVAATIVGVVVIASLWILSNKSKTKQLVSGSNSDRQLVIKENRSDTVIKINLPDGSLVQLEPHARIMYPGSFASNGREVHLEGNAFFDVEKNPSLPFNVYSDKLVTQVLGTSFYIKTDKVSNKIEVSVRTGKVSVYERGRDELSQRTGRKMNNSGVVITPNQKVTYYPELHHFITSIVEKPEVVDSSTMNANRNVFVFEDAKVSKVLEQLEKTYNISFVIENDNLGNCRFTGDIQKQDLFSKLDILSVSLGIDYEVKGTIILLKGNHCN